MGHLTESERFFICKRVASGVSAGVIASELGRAKSTISRELLRNKSKDTGLYSGIEAQTKTKARQSKANRRKKIMELLSDKSIEEMLFQLKIKKTSPEQIASILQNDYNEKISYQSIYRYILEDKTNGGKLYKFLCRKGRKHRYNKQETKVTISDKVSIELRPGRLWLLMFGGAGHWEIDTIFGKNQKSFLLTMVDIASMYTIVVKIPNKKAATIELALVEIINKMHIPIQSITSDNGGEFAQHKAISKRYNFIWYFCHPYCSGERGLNENTNGLIRRFLPKGTDFNLVTDNDILEIQNNLNSRPRKRLGFVRPAHAFVNLMMRNSELGRIAAPNPARIC